MAIRHDLGPTKPASFKWVGPGSNIIPEFKTFNLATKIEFEIPVLSRVTRQLFDACGRKRMTLLDSSLDEGSYGIFLKTKQLHSCIDVYMLKTRTTTLSRKCLILKWFPDSLSQTCRYTGDPILMTCLRELFWVGAVSDGVWLGGWKSWKNGLHCQLRLSFSLTWHC